MHADPLAEHGHRERHDEERRRIEHGGGVGQAHQADRAEEQQGHGQDAGAAQELEPEALGRDDLARRLAQEQQQEQQQIDQIARPGDLDDRIALGQVLGGRLHHGEAADAGQQERHAQAVVLRLARPRVAHPPCPPRVPASRPAATIEARVARRQPGKIDGRRAPTPNIRRHCPRSPWGRHHDGYPGGQGLLDRTQPTLRHRPDGRVGVARACRAGPDQGRRVLPDRLRLEPRHLRRPRAAAGSRSARSSSASTIR